MATERTRFYFYFEWRSYLKKMKDPDDYRKFVESILDYAQYGILPEWFDSGSGLDFAFAKPMEKIERDHNEYLRTCERNAKNIGKRWNGKRGIDVTPDDTHYTAGMDGNDSYTTYTSGNGSIPLNSDYDLDSDFEYESDKDIDSGFDSEKEREKENDCWHGLAEDKEGSVEKWEIEQAFSKQEISRTDFASALDADIVEQYGEDAYASFGEEAGHVLDDVDEVDAEKSAKSVSILADLPQANTADGASVILQALTPKQSIYVEPDEGESEEAFQARRRQEMIAKLMGSMPQEQTAYCAQRLSNVRTLGNLPEMRVV